MTPKCNTEALRARIVELLPRVDERAAAAALAGRTLMAEEMAELAASVREFMRLSDNTVAAHLASIAALGG